jgi:hypothetical protein
MKSEAGGKYKKANKLFKSALVPSSRRMGGQQQRDVYKCSLSSEAQTIAKTELREDEQTREHALEQFREWIEKHPSITKCRTDAVFLLRFLRTKKFSLPLAEDMLERYLTIRQLYPDWFQNLDIDDPEIESIIDAGYLVPLLQRDYHGRKVILSCAGKLYSWHSTNALLFYTCSTLQSLLHIITLISITLY